MEENGYINIELEDDDSFVSTNLDSSRHEFADAFWNIQDKVGDVFRQISALLESPLHVMSSTVDHAAYEAAKENIQSNPVWKTALVLASASPRSASDFASPHSGRQGSAKHTPAKATLSNGFVSPKPTGTPLKARKPELVESPLPKPVAPSPSALGDSKTPRKLGPHRSNSCNSAASSRIATPASKQREELVGLVSQLQTVIQTFGTKMAVFEERTKDLESLKGMLTNLQNTVNSNAAPQVLPAEDFAAPVPQMAPPPPPPAPPAPPPPRMSSSPTSHKTGLEMRAKPPAPEEKQAMSLSEALRSTPLLKRQRALLDKLDLESDKSKAAPQTEYKLRASSSSDEHVALKPVPFSASKIVGKQALHEHPPMKNYMTDILTGSFTLRRTNQRLDDGTIVVPKRSNEDRSPDPNNPNEVVFHELKRKFAQTYSHDDDEDDEGTTARRFDATSGVTSKGAHISITTVSNPPSSPSMRHSHGDGNGSRSLIEVDELIDTPSELHSEPQENPFVVESMPAKPVNDCTVPDSANPDDSEKESVTASGEAEIVKSVDSVKSGPKHHSRKKKKKHW